MQRVRLDSESLRSVGYDPETQQLEVEFVSDGVYRYEAVPPQVVLELLQSESQGAWFNQVFKPMGFAYSRLR
jgi:hypothetical protein